MQWYQIFQDGPEYEARKGRDFSVPTLTLKDVQDAVPKHLFKKNTLKSLFYIFRHLAIAVAFYQFARYIDALVLLLNRLCGFSDTTQALVRSLLWVMYWGWQGLVFTGIWCLGHEAGHDALSPYSVVNSAIGLTLHTFLLVPYFAWRITHRIHHQSTNNMQLDQTYVPLTRKDIGLPDGKVAVAMDYKEMIEETPAFTLFKLVMRQFLGFQLYLINNRKGNPRYPKGTSHYKSSSPLFKPKDRRAIIMSNISIGTMLGIIIITIYYTGWSWVWRTYVVPWLFANNWIVAITYLQHSDPTIPYYRKDQWTFARGALATVDRAFFGWVGRFLLHNLAHDHVAHHFFSSIPFYNQPKVTEAIRPVLGVYYNYDSTYAIYALWRSFTQCTFVESDGDILFFKNQRGEAVRALDRNHNRN